jgi:hypothetical protein
MRCDNKLQTRNTLRSCLHELRSRDLRNFIATVWELWSLPLSSVGGMLQFRNVSSAHVFLSPSKSLLLQLTRSRNAQFSTHCENLSSSKFLSSCISPNMTRGHCYHTWWRWILGAGCCVHEAYGEAAEGVYITGKYRSALFVKPVNGASPHLNRSLSLG